MSLDAITKQIISLFLVVLVGYYGRKRNIIDETLSKGLSKLLLEITLPLLIITSFCFTYDSSIKRNIIKSFVYGLAIFIVTPLFIKPFLIKIEKRKKNILKFALMYSNCGFMGFPLTASVFGQEGVIYTSIFNMIFNLSIWTYGVILFTETKDLKEVKKVFKNPGIISVFIGLAIMIFSIQIPTVILEPIKMVGGLTTPLSMLLIGSLLAAADIRKAIKDLSLYYGSFIKLIIIPAALYIVSILFDDKSLVIKTFILLQAMPAGATTTIFAENFNKEKEYSALIVSFSTMLSVITLPLIIRLLL